MGLFKKKTEKQLQTSAQSTAQLLFGRMVSSTSKVFEINDDEQLFFIALVEKMQTAGLSPGYLKLNRMSTGGIRVTHPACAVGIVKLRKTKYIQCPHSVYDVQSIDPATLEDAIRVIPIWVEYMQKAVIVKKAVLYG